ncbi:MAG TPA: amidohydrolase family protein [Hyphomicrobiales bacterium]|nr:amidohydrolase family protein [Hyphomicrobiales bacterium]
MSETPTRDRILELPEITVETDTRDYLAHATRQARSYDDYDLIVDVDAHVQEGGFWREILEYCPNDVLRYTGLTMHKGGNAMPLVNMEAGMNFQSMAGRVPHQSGPREKTEDPATHGHRFVQIVRRSMDAMGVDYQVIFPTAMLHVGMNPMEDIEVELSRAYVRWMTERILPEDDRVVALCYLPFNSPEDSEKLVAQVADNPQVVGFTICAVRHKPVHGNQYMRLYRMIEETGKPLAFHAGPFWGDPSFKQLNRFISMHALSFVHYNMIHMTNWIINAMPERFPKLKLMWVESGLAWIPYLMQRLDHEVLLRHNEAPGLKRRPSEYMREMFYSSQPMERFDLELLAMTMKKINAETQLLFSSDWPHWDFDPPSSITTLPFLSDQAKRNILGLNAARLFNLPRGRRRPRPDDVAATRRAELAV